MADIELGAVSYNFSSEVSGHPGATFTTMQTAGSNANEIITEIDKLAEEIKADLPEGMVLSDMMSTKDFLDASIANVMQTLLEAILLVIIVVYVFLQSIRSTFIPMIAIIVSLVGTFAFLYVAGFSINLLTLFALVLVIGTVVDDAIVVVEAVQAKFDEGYKSPYLATVDAMGGITAAIITTTLVFMAVFIPVSFMGGTTRNVLYAVRIDNGGGCCHIGYQRPDFKPGSLRLNYDSTYGSAGRGETELFFPLPHCFRHGIRQSARQI